MKTGNRSQKNAFVKNFILSSAKKNSAEVVALRSFNGCREKVPSKKKLRKVCLAKMSSSSRRVQFPATSSYYESPPTYAALQYLHAI